MPSAALNAMTSRPGDIEQLMAAHEAVGGIDPGRRYDVDALNRAGILLLCAHFEGYVEDLMAEALGALNPAFSVVPLTKNRGA